MSTIVGCRVTGFFDSEHRVEIPMALLYPAVGEEQTIQFGPYSIRAVPDAPVSIASRPLLVISHGNGGSPWVHRDLACFLARCGFVVALPEHVGNSRNDNSLAGTKANLENRPKQLARAIDAAFADAVVGQILELHRVGVIGHSIGAYTALACAGGRPVAGSHETQSGQVELVDVVRDDRLQALVLLAPATHWFAGDDALRHVSAEIFLRAGDADEITPLWHCERVLDGIENPGRVDFECVPNAGHFSFQSPFPDAMCSASFPPSQDPDGFNRAVYQNTLGKEIAGFFGRTL